MIIRVTDSTGDTGYPGPVGGFTGDSSAAAVGTCKPGSVAGSSAESGPAADAEKSTAQIAFLIGAERAHWFAALCWINSIVTWRYHGVQFLQRGIRYVNIDIKKKKIEHFSSEIKNVSHSV